MITQATLPALLAFDEAVETSDAFLQRAYSEFRRLICSQAFVVDGRNVYVPDNGVFMQVDTAFWHVCASDEGALGRYGSVDRAQHIPWIPAILRGADAGDVLEWEDTVQTKRGPELTRYLAPGDGSYRLVLRPIVRQGNNDWLLLTGFPQHSDRKRMRTVASWRVHQVTRGAR